MPRLYREVPVNSIWEGAGNIMCLDVLRALERTRGAAELLLREVAESAEADKRLRTAADRLERRLSGRDWQDESQARTVVRDLVLAMQAALLFRHTPSQVAEAFCLSRLGEEPGGTFGLLPTGIDLRAIVERAAPRPD
jgi:putative acyl-CoA dehydrogenase